MDIGTYGPRGLVVLWAPGYETMMYGLNWSDGILAPDASEVEGRTGLLVGKQIYPSASWRFTHSGDGIYPGDWTE